MENRRAGALLFSALMGSSECLALQALDGRSRQNLFCKLYVSQSPDSLSEMEGGSRWDG